MSDGGSRRRDWVCAPQVPDDVSGYQAQLSKVSRTHSSCFGFVKGRWLSLFLSWYVLDI